MNNQAVVQDAEKFQALLAEVVKAHPMFAIIKLNKQGVPMLSAHNVLHMGVFAVFIEQMGDLANAPSLGNLLSVSRLTCQNWINSHKASGVEIEWVFGRGTNRPHLEMKSWGCYSRECFNPIVPLVRAIIDRWIEEKND
ncbi:hypothetical protein IFT48_00310 [Pseudomonas fluorescens]|uniref:hypothetical protein n=1 Tax=Pseudomonas TaxID=286 RepID=UPI000F02AC32|nr:hypothetical protein [Pseudomonas viridiflava]MBD8088433.1 hypothetical protein [Pseudomonas fluorescens]MBD8615121.1 hypothetical protein [Pseudomonas putida]MBD8681204.1 hypothetical protein [Pseudomonas sp. CFBP 13719]